MCGADKAVAYTGCGVAIGTLIAVALYQSELVDELPDPPGRIFASEKITSSKMAHPFGIPDSYLGLASYGTTLTLLVLAEKKPWAKRLLGLKLAGDVSAAGFNAVRQVVSFGKLCSWCTGTAVATFVMAYGAREALGEAARVLRSEV